MKNWKDFDWTDSDGNTLPPEFKWAAVDKSGNCYAYDTKPLIVDAFFTCRRMNGTIPCENFQVEDWQKSLINRKDYKESDKSAFNEENLLEFIHLTGYDTPTLTSILNEFKTFLELRKAGLEELNKAMVVLEKHGYKFTKEG